jgi:hypothetical protein
MHMPHGAIRWRAEEDKQGFLFVSPIGPEGVRARHVPGPQPAHWRRPALPCARPEAEEGAAAP